MTNVVAVPPASRSAAPIAAPTAWSIVAAGRSIFVGALLVGATLWVYWPVRLHEFVAFDDAEYVTANPMVQAGLAWSGLKWAFTTGYFSYWHPLTWISHMLDVELFGANASGPHIVNALLHAANALLLFAVVRGLTGAFWRSFIVAALFALHPLRVESVAWVAERKDVLSGFFFLLTLWAYVRYAEVAAGVPACRPQSAPVGRQGRPPLPGAVWYLVALLLFACALMSKPMVVTLPCVLLLLDFWPLRRVTALGASWRGAVREKIPFFALSVAAAGITFLAQRQNGVVQSLAEFSFLERLGNAVVSYARYLGKTGWPAELAFFYPHPGTWPAIGIVGAVAVVAVITCGATWCRRRAPFAVVGWMWFAGMLVPTIGVIQVGGQALADRYTYLPHIGLFVALVWGVAALSARRALFGRVCGAAAALAIVGCALRARDQVRHWRDSESLFRHALAVTENNFFAHNNLGNVLVAKGRIDEAIEHYERAIAIRPHDDHAANNLGSVLLRQGRSDDAIPHLQRAVELQPELTAARHALCNALFRAGRAPEAIPHLRRILAVEPRNSEVHGDLGVALLQAGQPEEALANLEKALELGSDDAEVRRSVGRSLLQLGRAAEALPHLQAAQEASPGSGNSHYELALALFQSGQLPESIPHFETAARLQPKNAEVQSNVGWAMLVSGRVDDAIARFEAALAADPAATVAQTNLAGAWLRKRDARAAIACFETVLAREPQHVQALTDLAWVLATWPSATVRDAVRARELAWRANALTGDRDARVLRTLAAAEAESGNFSAALDTARRALVVAEANADAELGAALRDQIARYGVHAAFRDPIALEASEEANRL